MWGVNNSPTQSEFDGVESVALTIIRGSRITIRLRSNHVENVHDFIAVFALAEHPQHDITGKFNSCRHNEVKCGLCVCTREMLLTGLTDPRKFTRNVSTVTVTGMPSHAGSYVKYCTAQLISAGTCHC